MPATFGCVVVMAGQREIDFVVCGRGGRRTVFGDPS